MEPSVQVALEQDGYFVFRILPAPDFARMGPLFWPPLLRLDGYELAQTDDQGRFVSQVDSLLPGQVLLVMLYMTALQSMERNLAVSARLVTPAGELGAADDSWPARGMLATVNWVPGRLVRDTHYLKVPPEAAKTTLSLAVLVYDSLTLQPLAPAAGHILVTWHRR